MARPRSGWPSWAWRCPRWPSRSRRTSRRSARGNYVYTSGQLPMRSGELMATGKVGGEVVAEDAAACAQQCALNAIAAVKAEIGDLSAVKRVVKVVAFVASTPDFTGQPASPTAPPSCSARRSATPACTPAPRSAYRCCRWTPPSRSRSSSRSEPIGPDPAAAAEPGRARRAPSPTGPRTPVEPRDAATVVLLRAGDGSAGRSRSTCCAGTSMAFAAGMCVFPGGGVDPRDFDAAVALGRPVGRQTGPTCWRADEEMARALVCAAVRETFEESGVLLAGPGRAHRRRRHHRRRLGGATGGRWRPRSCRSPSSSTRRGLVLRTDLLRRVGGRGARRCSSRGGSDARFFVAAMPAGQRHPRRVHRVVDR